MTPADRPYTVPAWAGTAVIGATAVFDPWGWSVFGPAKLTAVTVATMALLAAALLSSREGRPFLLDHTSGVIGALLLMWIVLAASVGVDRLHGFIGTPDRRMGALTWLLFGAAFVGGQQLREPEDRRLVWRGAVVAGLIIGGYGAIELVFGAPVATSLATDRVGGIYGQPAYLGAAGVLLVPIAVVRALPGVETDRWRWVAAAAATLLVIAVLATQTRGAWVGLVAALLAVAGRVVPWLRRWPAAGIAAIALTVVLAVVTPLGARALSSFDLGDGTAGGRLDEWRVGAAVLADRPALGVGPEGYRVVFGSFVGAEYEQKYGRAVLPDRVHNGALDVGVSSGIPGMIGYLALLGVVLIGAYRRSRSASSDREKLVAGASFAALVGYVAQQQFLFPLAEIDPIFWLFAGMALAASPKSEDGEDHPDEAAVRPGAVQRRTVGGGLAGVLAVVALIAGGFDVVADHRLGRALDLASRGEVDAAVAAADSARAIRPDSIRYHFAAAAIASDGGRGALELAMDRNRAGLARSPDDPALRLQQAELLSEAALDDRSGADRALAAWLALADMDPNRSEVQLELGVAHYRVGAVDEALAAWDRAAALAPSSPAPLVNQGLALAEAGRTAEARAAIDEALRRSPDFLPARELLAVLEDAGDG